MAYVPARTRPIATILFAVYVAIGIIVANSHWYFRDLNDVKSFVSAVLAVVLWPLLLGHISLHVRSPRATDRSPSGPSATQIRPSSASIPPSHCPVDARQKGVG
jgi:hypothetical protein